MAGTQERAVRSELVSPEFRSAAAAIGIRELTTAEIFDRTHNFYRRRIEIGLNRPQGDDPKADDGFYSYSAEIVPPTLDDLRRVRAGTRATFAALGGSNIIIGEVEMQADGTIKLLDERRSEIPVSDDEDQAAKLTFAEFIGLVAEPISQIRTEDSGEGIYISAGYPLHTSVQEDGMVDGVVTSNQVSKRVVITDFDQVGDKRFLRGVIEQVNTNPEIKQKVTWGAVFNDTVAVAMDVYTAQSVVQDGMEIIPEGAVGGTGTNISVKDKRRNMMVDLETTKKEDDNPDIIMQRMVANYPLIFAKPITEGYTGMYTAYRLGEAVRELGERGFMADTEILGEALVSHDAEFVSNLAAGAVPLQYFHEELGQRISEVNRQELIYLAQKIMLRAAQEYGVMIAAAAFFTDTQASPDIRRAVPTEGSVILSGMVDERRTVKKETERAAAIAGQPGLHIVEASGGMGAAVYGLVEEQRLHREFVMRTTDIF